MTHILILCNSVSGRICVGRLSVPSESEASSNAPVQYFNTSKLLNDFNSKPV
jgi:hypothetical protein